MAIYKGDEFKEWNGDALITSLKDQSLRKIKFKDNEFISEQIIFQGNIGRIRDIKIQKETGELYMLSDNGELWRMYKNEKNILNIILHNFITNLYASNIKKVYFAGGCFWCMEESFDKVEGVIETISGYSGGHVKKP